MNSPHRTNEYARYISHKSGGHAPGNTTTIYIEFVVLPAARPSRIFEKWNLDFGVYFARCWLDELCCSLKALQSRALPCFFFLFIHYTDNARWAMANLPKMESMHALHLINSIKWKRLFQGLIRLAMQTHTHTHTRSRGATHRLLSV